MDDCAQRRTLKSLFLEQQKIVGYNPRRKLFVASCDIKVKEGPRILHASLRNVGYQAKDELKHRQIRDCGQGSPLQRRERRTCKLKIYEWREGIHFADCGGNGRHDTLQEMWRGAPNVHILCIFFMHIATVTCRFLFPLAPRQIIYQHIQEWIKSGPAESRVSLMPTDRLFEVP